MFTVVSELHKQLVYTRYLLIR